MTSSRPLHLIQELQDFIVERTSTVDALQREIDELRQERDDLKVEVNSLRLQNTALKEICGNSGRRRIFSQSEMTRYSNISACSTIENSTRYEILLEVNNSPKYGGSLSHKKFDRAHTHANRTTSSPPSSKPQGILPTVDDKPRDMMSRVTESRGESTSYETVDEKRETATLADPITNTPIKKSSSGRRSSVKRHRRSESGKHYELSSDLKAMALDCLESKYGGKELSNKAARVIQQYYRHYVLNRSFKRMRSLSGRKRAITMPERHFLKLKQSTLVFYGPENPVMIVDDTQSDAKDYQQEVEKEKCQQDMLKRTENIISTAVQEYPDTQDSASTDSGDSDDTDEIDDIDHVDLPPHDDADVLRDEKLPRDTGDISKDEKEENSSHTRRLSQSSSNGSSQYDIIDDSQVLTVVGRHIDLVDGSTFVVDKIHDHDSLDGTTFSAPSCIQGEDDDDDDAFDLAVHKRQFRIGVNLFNWKPEVGIQYLIDNGHLKNDIKSIADFFRRETSISKQKISEYFGSLRNDFNMSVLLEFAKSFDYVNKEVDEALRQFQSYFKLTGEAQTVEKFLQVFSDRYNECNPEKFPDNPDIILLLAYALAMLNTDLHNQNVKRRMTVEDFIKNLRGADNGKDLDQDMLRGMYSRIHKNEFATGADHTTQLYQIENSFLGKVPNLSASHRQFVKLFTVEEVYDPNRKDKPHNRLAFLFNDLLLLAKPREKNSAHGSNHHMFAYKSSYSLLGKKVAEFSNEFYPHGVGLLSKIDNKMVASFNAKDEKTKKSFVNELDEYILETNGMENIRIALSKVTQLSWHNKRKKEDRTKSLLLPDIPTKISAQHDAMSLTDLREGVVSEDIFKQKAIMSSSTGHLPETSEPEDDLSPEQLVRSGSTNSLDPVMLSDSVKSPPSIIKRQRSSLISTIREAVTYSPHITRRKGSSLNRLESANTRPKEHRRSMPVILHSAKDKF